MATKKPTRTKSGDSKSGTSSSKRTSAKKSVKKAASRKPAVKSTAKRSTKSTAASAEPKKAAKPVVENKVLKSILHSLGEMKAEDTITLDLSDKSSIGETMVVTTGRSNTHVGSIADRVVKDLKAIGVTGVAVEGLRQGDWVVIDAASVVVHVFRPEVRAFYAIEKMWSA